MHTGRSNLKMFRCLLRNIPPLLVYTLVPGDGREFSRSNFRDLVLNNQVLKGSDAKNLSKQLFLINFVRFALSVLLYHAAVSRL